MNIIITSPSLDPNINVSGISSVTQFIIKNNRSYNYIHFEVGRRDGESKNILRLLRLIISFFKWLSLITKKREILIHYNFPLSKPSILRDPFFIFAAVLLKKKLIIHIHGGEFLMSKNTPGWIVFILDKIFGTGCPIVVLSDLEKKIIEERYKAKRVFSLPNCVDIIASTDINIHNESDKKINLLFLGRITESKGLEFVYDGIKSLILEGYSLNFFLAGKGNLQEEYVAKFANLLGKNFEFCGVVSGDKKTELLNKCNVFILPAIFGEGLPMAMLETMSLGIVPIVTDDGSIGEVIENNKNGIIVRKSYADDIKNAIILLSQNKDLMKKLSFEAIKTIKERFNPHDYIYKLNKIYENA